MMSGFPLFEVYIYLTNVSIRLLSSENLIAVGEGIEPSWSG